MQSHIYYTFLAGWCADAAGARLEFRRTTFTEQQAIDAMHFVGEKSTGVPEGQITDDSEMELCLLQALVNCKNQPYFPIEEIAEEYIKWNKSKPFDMGATTRHALLNANNADDMANNAFTYNEKSQSNGSLMRCLPISVFCMNKSEDIILEVATADASLTHSSNIVHLITGIYCCVLAKILSHRTNFKFTKAICVDELIEIVYKLTTNEKDIRAWMEHGLGLSDLSTYNCIKNEGHVKHAFILFIFFLHLFSFKMPILS